MLYILMGTKRAVVKVNEIVEVKLLKGSFMRCVQFLQLCPTLCNRMDSTLPGSSVHGIYLPRILEWAAMLSSRGSSPSRD